MFGREVRNLGRFHRKNELNSGNTIYFEKLWNSPSAIARLDLYIFKRQKEGRHFSMLP